MERYGTQGHRRGRRIAGALTALAAAGGLLLTGCGDGSGHSSYKSDSSKATGFPAPRQTADDRDMREDTSEHTDDTERAPDLVSTFALDVDTASYGYTRRVLADGGLPEPSQVRPEEFVNSFRQEYERPDGNGFTVTVDGARTDAEDWSLVRVGLATRLPERQDERPPAALTFVVDVSGSMAEPGRLDLAKESLGVMTDRLRDDDSVALVAFSDEAETVLPMTPLEGNRDVVREAVDRLRVRASTNLGAGVETGYVTAVEGLREGATNRVVLVSDALANTGDTDADTILEKIADSRREHGITLFGVGVGSEYGDALMERLADRGDGHTVYVSDAEDAREVFTEQLPRHVDLTARDAKAQIAFDPATVKEYRLVGYDNRAVADEDFRDDAVDGGEVGPGHTVTALYAVRTAPGASGHLATATVRWLDPKTRTPHERSGRLETSALHRSVSAAAPRFQVAVAAAYFADALSASEGSRLPGAPGLGRLAEDTEELADRTEDPAVEDLADAVRQADRLM
jgi:Ca-activated chloride channel family protein